MTKANINGNVSITFDGDISIRYEEHSKCYDSHAEINLHGKSTMDCDLNAIAEGFKNFCRKNGHKHYRKAVHRPAISATEDKLTPNERRELERLLAKARS